MKSFQLFKALLFAVLQIGRTEKGKWRWLDMQTSAYEQLDCIWWNKYIFLGIIITGSGGRDGQISSSVEVLKSDGTPLCSLPSLPYPTWGHTQHGLTTCGGTRGELRRRCYTFDTNSGTWNVSHNLLEVRAYHTKWSVGEDVLLLGGSTKNIGVKSGELIREGSESVPIAFELKYTSR